jgi:protein-disulfide isomerase
LSSRKEQREEARRQREEREAEERAKQRRKRRLWQLGATLSVAAAVVLIAVLVSSSGGGSGGGGSSKGQATDATQVNDMLAGIPQNGVTLGKANAPVTVTEFADLKCPFCKDYTLTTQPDILTKYVRTGKAKIVFRNLAFVGADPSDTRRAAVAAIAASLQNKLWNFSDIFYHNQGDESASYVTDAFVTKIAKAVPGLDVNKLLADRESPTTQQLFEDASTEAKKFNVDSTPTFFVQRAGGTATKVGNFQQLGQAIDSALNSGA